MTNRHNQLFWVDLSCGDEEVADQMWAWGSSPSRLTCAECLGEELPEVIRTAEPAEPGETRTCETRACRMRQARNRTHRR